MRYNVTNYYQLLQFGLGNGTFQSFVDKFKLKYNDPQTEGYRWDSEIQLDYTYEQLLASLNVATLPIYVDVDSEGLDKKLGDFKIGSNKIPTQKHVYNINAKMLREKMIMVQRYGDAALTSETRLALMDLLFESTDKLLGGNRNALTHQRMRINSTGQFTIGLDNNPRGIKGITFDFNVPAANKNILTGNKLFWTNAEHVVANEGSESDPIKFLKDLVKKAKKMGWPKFHLEMAVDLFDDILTHSAVLKRIGYANYPTLSADEQAIAYAQNMTDDALKAMLERLIGAPIKVYDTLAYVEKLNENTGEIETIPVENFKKTNISIIPDGEIGTIKSVKPMVFTDDPTQHIAWFDGGRTLVTDRFNSKTKSMYVESEMAVLLVPAMAQFMGINTVTV